MSQKLVAKVLLNQIRTGVERVSAMGYLRESGMEVRTISPALQRKQGAKWEVLLSADEPISELGELLHGGLGEISRAEVAVEG